MRKLILLLLTMELLANALGRLPETSVPEPPAVVVPAPAEENELRDLLERLVREFDPAAGTVGAVRWAEKLLGAWERSGEDADAARAAASAVDAQALAERLPKLRWAAEKLSSGADLGLMNEPGHKSDWTNTDPDALFSALLEGMDGKESEWDS